MFRGVGEWFASYLACDVVAFWSLLAAPRLPPAGSGVCGRNAQTGEWRRHVRLPGPAPFTELWVVAADVNSRQAGWSVGCLAGENLCPVQAAVTALGHTHANFGVAAAQNVGPVP